MRKANSILIKLASIILLSVFTFSFIGKKIYAETVVPQWTLDGEAINTGSDTGLTDLQDVISDGAGGMIILFQDTGYDLFAQKVDSSGAKQWGPSGVTVFSAVGDQVASEIVSDGVGGFIVAWADSSGGIFAQRVNGSGSNLWGVSGTQIKPTPTGIHDLFVHATSDGAGGAIITWIDDRSGGGDGASYKVYAQRLDASGVEQWTAAGVELTTSTFISSGNYIKIISDGSGGAIVTWVSSLSGNDDVYAQKVDSSGSRQWGTNGIDLSNVAGAQLQPVLISDGAGGVIVAWTDYRDGDADVYVQKVSSAGSAQWTANGVGISVISGSSQSYQFIVPDGSGGAIMSWSDGRGGGQNVYAQRVDSNGIAQWTANGKAITTLGDSYYTDNMVSDGSNGAYIAIYDSTSGGDLYVQRINSSGTAKWPNDGVTITAAAGDQFSTSMINNPASGLVTAWVDYRVGGGAEIYGQRFTFGYQITNLPVNLDAQKPTGESLKEYSIDYSISASQNINLKDVGNGVLIAQSVVDLTSDRNWGTVSGGSDLVNAKTLIQGLATASGSSATYTAYVPKLTGNDGILTCPDASSLAQITLNCTNRSFTSGYSTTNIGGQDYWVITNVSSDLKAMSINSSSLIINSKITTKTTIKSNKNPSYVGDAVSIEIDITDGNSVVFSSPVITGTVTLYTANNLIGTATIDSNGIATLVVSNFIAADHILSAVYSGDSNYEGSTSDNFLQIVYPVQSSGQSKINSTVEIQLSSSKIKEKESVVVTATIGTANGFISSGEAKLFIDNIYISTQNISAGEASFVVENLTSGEHVIKVVYPGDSTYAQSESDESIVSVLPAEIIPSYPVSENGSTNSSGSSSQNSSNSSGLENLFNSISQSVKGIVNSSTNLILASPAIAILGIVLFLSTSAEVLFSAFQIAGVRGIFTGIFIPKKKKYWGIIIDQKTDKPIPFVIIRLLDNSGNIVKQAISNLDGKYRFGVTEKNKEFILEAKSGGYELYRKNIFTKSEDETMEDIYLVRVGQSSIVKTLVNYYKKEAVEFFRKLINLLALVGLILNVIGVLTSPNPYNIFLTLLYTIMLVGIVYLYIINRIKISGKVFDSLRHPLAGVSVRLYDRAKKQVLVTISDLNGDLRFNVEKGIYYINAFKNGYKMQNVTGLWELSEIEITEEGFLKKSVMLERVSRSINESATGLLPTPFGS